MPLPISPNAARKSQIILAARDILRVAVDAPDLPGNSRDLRFCIRIAAITLDHAVAAAEPGRGLARTLSIRVRALHAALDRMAQPADPIDIEPATLIGVTVNAEPVALALRDPVRRLGDLVLQLDPSRAELLSPWHDQPPATPTVED
ncbi:MAG: hypothetical protein Alpg2KO_01260 [Alphaproteobacteria bacterium]